MDYKEDPKKQGYNNGGYGQGYNNGGYGQGNNQGYNQGYNNQGYNQSYNNQGYNNQGYNQGYNNQGYNQGYNNQGYNQGYNNGYNNGGYNQGYNNGGCPPPKPQNYLVFSILTTLFCCLPAGIAALVFSFQTDSAYNAGDYMKAQEKSNQAKTWCIVSACVGFFCSLIYFITVVASEL